MGEYTDYTREVYYDLKEFVVNKPFENPKVSVVIYCHNVEKTLDACLETLIMQTLKEIEIICVNNDSHDFTLGILGAYSWADKRIKVIETKQKKEDAIKRGFDIAKGEYVISINANKKLGVNYLGRFYNRNLAEKNTEKNILVFNTACFGDVLLCNSLIQNIKKAYPKSKVIFICDKNWYDIAKNQEGVDDVVIYDKKGEHKGFFGMLKFVRNFKYKKPFASFITYKNERNFVISKLLRSRFTISENKKYKYLSKQEQHSKLLENLTHQCIQNLPIKFNVPNDITNKVNINEKYLVLCTTSKKLTKDMPIDTAIELINLINKNTDYKVVFTGIGQKAVDYSLKLLDAGCNFIDLTNKTSLLELAKVIKNAEALISVDTGTMHLGYALRTPTVAVFYEQNTTNTWAPDEKIYEVKVLSNNIDTNSIYEYAISFIQKNEVVYE